MKPTKDLERLRRANLGRWIKENFPGKNGQGNQREFCRQATDAEGAPLNPSVVSGILKGTRSFAEDAVRGIEARGNIPRMWLDIDHDAPTDKSANGTAILDFEAIEIVALGMIHAMVKSESIAAAEFYRHVHAQVVARQKHGEFRDDKGLVSRALNIAKPAHDKLKAEFQDSLPSDLTQRQKLRS